MAFTRTRGSEFLECHPPTAELSVFVFEQEFEFKFVYSFGFGKSVVVCDEKKATAIFGKGCGFTIRMEQDSSPSLFCLPQNFKNKEVLFLYSFTI